MLHFGIQILTWFVVCVLVMSFAEHLVHRWVMHRKSIFSGLIPNLNKVFKHHAIEHHGHYRTIFTDEPMPPGKDKGIRLNLKEGFLEAIPVAAIFAAISWVGAVVLEIVVCSHHYVWNMLHLEMHKPVGRFFSNWRLYKFLRRHHYMHHRHPDKNFNVVLPIADYVLGTNIAANQADLRAMYRLGLLERRRLPQPARTASTANTASLVR